MHALKHEKQAEVNGLAGKEEKGGAGKIVHTCSSHPCEA